MNRKNSISKWAMSIHGWLGMVTGIFLLMMGLSGSMIVFLKETDHSLNAELLHVKQQGEKLSLDVLYRQTAKDHPNLTRIAWLNPNAAANEAYEFRLYQNDGKISTYDLGMVNLNPYTGKVLRQGNLTSLSPGLMHWMYQFHWSFQLGLPGLLLATVFGLTMLLSILSGFTIYRKYIWRVLTFRTAISFKNWRTISSGLHRSVGVWALVFNVLIFFTGFWMNKFSMDKHYWRKQTVANEPSVLSTQSIDSMLLIAKKEMPDLIISNISFPTQPGKDFSIRGTVQGQSAFFENGNSVSVDPVTGKVTEVERLAEKSFLEKAEATFMPLHTGTFGGIATRVLYVIVGLLPGLLSVTGALLWWRRVRKRLPEFE